MSDFHNEGENRRVLRPIPEEVHRANSIRAVNNLVTEDPHPHDLLEILFSKEELQWLRENLHT